MAANCFVRFLFTRLFDNGRKWHLSVCSCGYCTLAFAGSRVVVTIYTNAWTARCPAFHTWVLTVFQSWFLLPTTLNSDIHSILWGNYPELAQATNFLPSYRLEYLLQLFFESSYSFEWGVQLRKFGTSNLLSQDYNVWYKPPRHMLTFIVVSSTLFCFLYLKRFDSKMFWQAKPRKSVNLIEVLWLLSLASQNCV